MHATLDEKEIGDTELMQRNMLVLKISKKKYIEHKHHVSEMWIQYACHTCNRHARGTMILKHLSWHLCSFMVHPE